MTVEEIVTLLLDEGFTSGWSLLGTDLTLWEHGQDPPAPLTRPEATDEAPIAD
jgi:hypothetical protein